MTNDVIEKAKHKAWLGDKREKARRKWTGSERELHQLEYLAASLSSIADEVRDAARRARQVVKRVEAEARKAQRRAP